MIGNWSVLISVLSSILDFTKLHYFFLRIIVIPIKNTNPKNRFNGADGEPSLVDSVKSLDIELDVVELGGSVLVGVVELEELD